jgi:hypothetical protein
VQKDRWNSTGNDFFRHPLSSSFPSFRNSSPSFFHYFITFIILKSPSLLPYSSRLLARLTGRPLSPYFLPYSFSHSFNITVNVLMTWHKHTECKPWLWSQTSSAFLSHSGCPICCTCAHNATRTFPQSPPYLTPTLSVSILFVSPTRRAMFA